VHQRGTCSGFLLWLRQCRTSFRWLQLVTSCFPPCTLPLQEYHSSVDQVPGQSCPAHLQLVQKTAMNFASGVELHWKIASFLDAALGMHQWYSNNDILWARIMWQS
jgi:hypothetical protein